MNVCTTVHVSECSLGPCKKKQSIPKSRHNNKCFCISKLWSHDVIMLTHNEE